MFSSGRLVVVVMVDVFGDTKRKKTNKTNKSQKSVQLSSVTSRKCVRCVCMLETKRNGLSKTFSLLMTKV